MLYLDKCKQIAFTYFYAPFFYWCRHLFLCNYQCQKVRDNYVVSLLRFTKSLRSIILDGEGGYKKLKSILIWPCVLWIPINGDSDKVSIYALGSVNYYKTL